MSYAHFVSIDSLFVPIEKAHTHKRSKKHRLIDFEHELDEYTIAILARQLSHIF